MAYRIYVITANTARYNGTEKDLSGPALVKTLEQAGYTIAGQQILPDERKVLADSMKAICDKNAADIIITTGGTGFNPEDCAPEATLDILERLTPGIPEAMRAHAMQTSPLGVLTRAVAGIRRKTLIVNLPGSPKACMESMDAFLDTIPHGLELLRGTVADCARP